MLMALVFPHIVDLMVIGLATIVIFAPITLLALVHKNPWNYSRIALASILSGFIVNLGFFIGGILYPEIIEIKASFIPAFIVASLVLALGMIFKKKNQLYYVLVRARCEAEKNHKIRRIS